MRGARPRSRHRRPIAIALALLAGAAGCGGDDDSAGSAKAAGASAAQAVGTKSAGSVVQFADCRDWRAGSTAERRATVVALRGQLTPQTSETAESPLPDDRAYEIIQKACKPSYSSSLRLYKLYVRAQGFAPLSE